MSINRICTSCKATFKLETLLCPRCKVNLTKFKVRIRTAQGWKTLQTDSLRDAKKFNSGFTLPASSSVSGNGHQGSAVQLTPMVTPLADQSCMLQDVFDSFITWAETHKRSWKSDKHLFELRLAPLSLLPLDLITPDMVQKLIDGLKPIRKEGGKLAPATKLQAAALIRRLFNFAKKRRMWSGENPITYIELEKFDNRRERYLSQDELQRLITELDKDCNPTAALFIRFLLLTGRRRGEVLKLEWSDVDLERGLIRFRHTKNGKTQVVPVNSQALIILKDAAMLSGSLHSNGSVTPHSPQESLRVFPFKSSWTLERVWKRIRRRAGLADFRLHDLRHSFASLAASSGQVDIYTLQNLLGHRSIVMTQRYAHLFPGALRGAAEVVGAMVQPSHTKA
jgi:integrase